MAAREKLYFVFKLAFSGCLVAWVVSKVNLAQITSILASAKIHFILLGIVWLLLDRVLMSYRWNILLKEKNIRIPFSQIVRIYFVGAFSGNFLPSSIASDAVRGYFASKYNAETHHIVSSVFVDRILGLFSLSVIAVFSLFFIALEKGEFNARGLLAALVVFLFVTLLAFSEKVIEWIPFTRWANYFSFTGRGIIWNTIEKIYGSCNEYKKNHGVIYRALFVSFIIHILSILAVYVLSLSVSIHVPLAHLFLFVPLINLLIMLPISIGGIGVQEGAFIYFYSQMGIPSDRALTVAIIFRLLAVIMSLPGGVFYVMGTQKKKVLFSE